MAVQPSCSTPKKVYSRSSNSYCRLCGELNEPSRLCHVFHKTGQTKNLHHKIFQTCGIDLNDLDILPNTICRKCDRYVEKMWTYRQNCAQNQIKLRQTFSVKRMHNSATVASNNDDQILDDTSARKKLSMDTHDTQEPKSDPSHCQTYDSDVTSISVGEVDKIIKAIKTRNPLVIAEIMLSVAKIKLAVKRLITTELDAACKSLCKRKGNGSVLLNHTYNGLVEFSSDAIWKEIISNHAYLVDILNAVSGKNAEAIFTPKHLQLKYTFIYSILMNIRWHELSLFQRINSILLIEGGCSKELQTRLNKLGVALYHTRKDMLLELVGGHFMDKAVRKIKEGKTFRGTGDNWDIRILKSHMRADHQNEDLHLLSSNLIENRICFNHLENENPKCDIRFLPNSSFSLNMNEIKHYMDTSKVIIGRILLQYFTQFSFLKKCLPTHIRHRYTGEMSAKSNIISMPIIDANENNYNDCVKILRTYETWIMDLYHEAGLLEEKPNRYDPEFVIGQVPPGQPLSNTIFTEGDVMKDMKIPFSGDQLTRVRFAGAKHLLAGSHTPVDRFEHCSPFKGVMWHTKASLLQYTYQLLYNAESVTEIGTLKYFREKFNRKNVTPRKVLDSYQGCEELMISMGKAYIIAAAMEILGMKSLDDKPTHHKFPTNLMHSTLNEKKAYLDDVLQSFIDQFVIQKSTATCSDDYVMNYGLCSIFLTVLILQMKDTAKEGDGERNLINQKLLLTIFKSFGQYSKYAIEMFLCIAQVESLLTPRLSEQFKWSYFVNWKGGIGQNMEEDLAHEITNKISKGIVHRLGPNKTMNSISKICKATSGIKEITENVDIGFQVAKHSVQHTTRDSENDEKQMINDLLILTPFKPTSKRAHNSFPEIKRTPLLYLNILEFHKWLDNHKKEIALLQ